MPSAAHANEKYKYFRTLIPAEQASFQLKLTYTGKQVESAWTLILHSNGEAADARLFEKFHRQRIDYAHDAQIRSAEITSAEIDALVTNIGSLLHITDPNAGRPGVFVSFSMLVRAPTTRAFESFVAREEVDKLLENLRTALGSNPAATRLVDEFAALRNPVAGAPEGKQPPVQAGLPTIDD